MTKGKTYSHGELLPEKSGDSPQERGNLFKGKRVWLMSEQAVRDYIESHQDLTEGAIEDIRECYHDNGEVEVQE